MTREEAMRRLDGMKSLYPYENNPHKEAIDMAIEALTEPSECESCKWYEPNHLICYPKSSAEPSKVDYRTDESANIGTEVNDLISRSNAIEHLKNVKVSYPHADISLPIDLAIKAIEILPSAEPIERISDNTIVVKYADYEDIGRIILTNGDIFCKMFYEDDRQNDDSDYDSLVPDEYKTEPSDLISRADAIGIIEDYIGKDYMTPMSRLYSVRSKLSALPSADRPQGEWEHWGSPFSDESEVIDTIVCSVCGARMEKTK